MDAWRQSWRRGELCRRTARRGYKHSPFAKAHSMMELAPGFDESAVVCLREMLSPELEDMTMRRGWARSFPVHRNSAVYVVYFSGSWTAGCGRGSAPRLAELARPGADRGIARDRPAGPRFGQGHAVAGGFPGAIGARDRQRQAVRYGIRGPGARICRKEWLASTPRPARGSGSTSTTIT